MCIVPYLNTRRKLALLRNRYIMRKINIQKMGIGKVRGKGKKGRRQARQGKGQAASKITRYS
jgi:hypothetical protein